MAKNPIKLPEKRISTHLTLLLVSIFVLIAIISFVVLSNSKAINSNNNKSSESTSSIVSGDILSDAISTYSPKNDVVVNNNTSSEDSNNIMNNRPLVNNSFVITKGDSLALLTRNYIKDYISKNNVEISKVQRMYVEGVYIYNRKYPILEIGQNVIIDENEIVDLINKSGNLSSKTLSIWAYYAKNID